MNRTHAAHSSRRSIPVYREVYQRFRSEILSGRLAAGARLPSSRTLAAELGIARGRCSLKASGHNGLMIGYTNVAKENAASATRRMLGAMQAVR